MPAGSGSRTSRAARSCARATTPGPAPTRSVRRCPRRRCPVGRELDEITPELQEFLESQPVFFVATAPASTDEHVNVSPKGLDSFRVLGPHQVAYLDLTGSGIETISHLRENGRITLMFCAFSGNPDIVRLQGTGRVVRAEDPEAEPLLARFPELPGVRAVIVVDVRRVASSCGYGV